jgi:hypothetical protein
MAPVISRVSLLSKSICHIYTLPGFLYNDTVTFAPGLAVSQQPIGVAVNSSGIFPFDGILG